MAANHLTLLGWLPFVSLRYTSQPESLPGQICYPALFCMMRPGGKKKQSKATENGGKGTQG